MHLAPEMRSLIDKVFSVNVVAVRSQPSLTSDFNAPGVKCVDQRTNAVLCPQLAAGSPMRTTKAVRILCVGFSFYYL
jgi:hypothetical protein